MTFLAKAFPLELDAITEDAIILSGPLVFGGGPEKKHLGTLPSVVGLNRGNGTFDELQTTYGISVPSVERPGWLKSWGDSYALNACFSPERFRELLSWIVPLSERNEWCFRAAVYVDDFQEARGAASEQKFLSGEGIFGDLFNFQAMRREEPEQCT